jgi:WG repeat protein
MRDRPDTVGRSGTRPPVRRNAVAAGLAALAACGAPAPPPPRTPVAEVPASHEQPLPPAPPLVEQRDAKILPPDDRSCEPTMFTDHAAGSRGLWAFEDATGLYGFRDRSGKTVVPPTFRFLYQLNEHGVTGAVDDGGPAFVDETGRVLARAYAYDNGPDYFVGGMARIVANGKVGFLADDGKIAVAPSWDWAAPFCAGRAVVCRDCTIDTGDDEGGVVRGGKWGYIDRRGTVAVPLELDVADSFDHGSARVVRGALMQRIDPYGRVLETLPLAQ